MKKHISRFLLLVLAACTCLTSCETSAPTPLETTQSTTQITTTDKEPPADTEFILTAEEFVRQMTAGINIGNTLDSYYPDTIGGGSLSNETLWGNPKITKSLFTSISKMGFTTVRIPVTWFPHMDPATGVIRPTWMSRVKEVVDMALAEDLVVILNVHHDTASGKWLSLDEENFDAVKARYASLWQQIGSTFADYGENLLFEGFNEIFGTSEGSEHTSPGTTARLNELNQLFVDTVRETGSKNAKRYLICSTYFTRTRPQITDSFVLPTDTVADHLIVQVHTYTTTRTELIPQLAHLYEHFVLEDIPVIIGECGYKTDAGQGGSAVTTWGQTLFSYARKWGMRVILWDTGNAGDYQYLDRTALSFRNSALLRTIKAEWQKEQPYLSPLPEYEDVTGNLATGAWSGYAGSGGVAQFDKTDGVTVKVTDPGTLIWSVQTFASLPKMEIGKTYRLTLTYDNPTDQYIPVKIGEIFATLDPHTENDKVETVIEVYEKSIESVSVVLYVGIPGHAEPYSIHIDPVDLREVRISE